MTTALFFQSFLYSLFATVAGGVFLALLFFLFKEKVFPLPDVAGRWYFEIRTTYTDYRPYDGMVLRYVAMLWLVGNRVEGTVEKAYEKSSTGERSYVGKNRTRGYVSGFVEKNYLSRDRVVLHVVEDGHGRESTNFFDLVFSKKSVMVGGFSSMVAEQSGVAEWRRSSF